MCIHTQYVHNVAHQREHVRPWPSKSIDRVHLSSKPHEPQQLKQRCWVHCILTSPILKHETWTMMKHASMRAWWSKCRHHPPGYRGFILAFGLRALPNWYQSSASLSVQICACRAITMKASTAASKASWWRPACTRALELGTWTHGFCAAWHDNKWTQRSDSYGPDSKHQTSHNFIAVHWWDMMRSLMILFFRKKKNIDVHCMLSLYLRIFVPKHPIEASVRPGQALTSCAIQRALCADAAFLESVDEYRWVQ